MEVICFDEIAFYKILDKVTEYIKEKHSIQRDKWISGEEAMAMMRITSKTTLQKFRDEGKIKFSQPEKKIILYDSDSISEFLEKNSHNTF